LVTVLRGIEGLVELPEAVASKRDVAMALVDNGADPSIICEISKLQKFVPICQAADLGGVDMMKSMLDKGADINSETVPSSLLKITATGLAGNNGGKGYTPLIIALMNGKADVATFLIDKGASLKIGVHGLSILSSGSIICLGMAKNKTPLYWAIEMGDIDVIIKMGEKMTWKFNPDFTFRQLGTVKGDFGYGCKFGAKTSVSHSTYANNMGQKKSLNTYLQKDCNG
jgi:ankyrin repeat protein